MTFSRLVAALYGSGVTYWTKADGTLGYRAPAGALTPELRAAMREHRDDLLFLCSGAVTIYGRACEPQEWEVPLLAPPPRRVVDKKLDPVTGHLWVKYLDSDAYVDLGWAGLLEELEAA